MLVNHIHPISLHAVRPITVSVKNILLRGLVALLADILPDIIRVVAIEVHHSAIFAIAKLLHKAKHLLALAAIIANQQAGNFPGLVGHILHVRPIVGAAQIRHVIAGLQAVQINLGNAAGAVHQQHRCVRGQQKFLAVQLNLAARQISLSLVVGGHVVFANVADAAGPANLKSHHVARGAFQLVHLPIAVGRNMIGLLQAVGKPGYGNGFPGAGRHHAKLIFLAQGVVLIQLIGRRLLLVRLRQVQHTRHISGGLTAATGKYRQKIIILVKQTNFDRLTHVIIRPRQLLQLSLSAAHRVHKQFNIILVGQLQIRVGVAQSPH